MEPENDMALFLERKPLVQVSEITQTVLNNGCPAPDSLPVEFKT